MDKMLLFGGAAVLVLWLAGRRTAKALSPGGGSDLGSSYGDGGFGGGGGGGGGGGIVGPLNLDPGPSFMGQYTKPLFQVNAPQDIGLRFVQDIGVQKKKTESDLSDAPLLRRGDADLALGAMVRSARIDGSTSGASQYAGVTTPSVAGTSDAQTARQVVASAAAKNSLILAPAMPKSSQMNVVTRALPGNERAAQSAVASSRVAPSISTGFPAVATSFAAAPVRSQVAKQTVAAAVAAPLRVSAPAVARVAAPVAPLRVGTSFLTSIGR